MPYVKKLKNHDITLISSNCNGACILNDLHLPFQSPFVNLWIKPADFLKLCENLRYYMDCELSFVTEEGISYPVGALNDIRIYFQHYASEEEAQAAWNRRKRRMNWERVYILFSDRDGCSEEDLLRFDRLPYQHKVAFCHQSHPEIQSAVLIPGFEGGKSVGICSDYTSWFSLKKYYDAFDYVSWFNQRDNVATRRGGL